MSSLDEAIRKRQPTNREYEMKFKIDRKVLMVRDQTLNGQWNNSEQEIIYLVPEASTQTTLFYNAWLPGTAYEFVDGVESERIVRQEVAVEVGHPLYAPIRCAVCRRNKNYGEHHLVVMSEPCYDALRSMVGKTIIGKVLPEMEAEKALG